MAKNEVIAMRFFFYNDKHFKMIVFLVYFIEIEVIEHAHFKKKVPFLSR